MQPVSNGPDIQTPGLFVSFPANDINGEATLGSSTFSAPRHTLANSTGSPPNLIGLTQEGNRDPATHLASPTNQPPSLSSPPNPGPSTSLQSKFKQNLASWFLAGFTSCLLAFSIWFIYTEFINTKQIHRHMQLSPSHTVTVVNILSQLNIFLAWAPIDAVFETLRWTMACRTQGVLITTFISMSRVTGFDGVANLLRVPGWHLIWCFQRYFGLRRPRRLN